MERTKKTENNEKEKVKEVCIVLAYWAKL